MSAAILLSRRRGVLAEGGGGGAAGVDAVAMEDSGVMLLEDDSGSIALED